MTSIYEVKTKHTKKVLEDFISFTYCMKANMIVGKLVVFATCFLLLAYISRGTTPMYVFGAIGILIIVFIFMRKKLAFQKLSKNDPNYQEQSEIVFTFGYSEFWVDNKEAAEVEHVRYAQITSLYVDDRYYYVGVNNEDMHMLPKADFTVGKPEAFEEFIGKCAGKEVKPTKVPFKQRYREALEKQKELDARREAERVARKK